MLGKFVNWFNDNRLFINTEKTVFVYFTPRNKIMNQSMLIKSNGKSIQQVEHVKFLGLYLENSMSWEKHISELSKKYHLLVMPYIG